MEITEVTLKGLGFICERNVNYDDFVDGIWHKDGIVLFQSWSDNSFNFATRLRHDGEFKSGYAIQTMERLYLLYEGLTGNKLPTNLNVSHD